MIPKSPSMRQESPSSWKRKDMKATQEKRHKYYVLGFYVVLLAIWQALFSLRLVPDYLFPSPLQVAGRLRDLAIDGLLWPSIKATLWRMIIGFSFAGGIGLLIGLLMGMSRIVNRCLR